MYFDLVKGSAEIRKLEKHEQPPSELLLLADPSEDQISSYIKQSKIFIAEVDSHVVGVCAISETSTSNYEIQNIAVAESAQGHGIGTQLLQRAIAYVQSLNAETLITCTADTSAGQQYLYQKVGFHADAIDKDYFIRQYTHPIYENGTQCRDRVIMRMNFKKISH
ncbi:MAG: GNAT family N-acetyltransferase [Cyclobacteriaceae bacterium]